MYRSFPISFRCSALVAASASRSQVLGVPHPSLFLKTRSRARKAKNTSPKSMFLRGHTTSSQNLVRAARILVANPSQCAVELHGEWSSRVHVPHRGKKRRGDFCFVRVGYSIRVVQRVRRVFPRNACGNGLDDSANEGLRAHDVRAYALGGMRAGRTLVY